MKIKLKSLFSPVNLIFLSTLIIRIIYIIWYYKFSPESLRLYIPLSDQKTYDFLAKDFLEGYGMNWLGILKATYPPLYPIFLSFIYFLTGNNYISYFAVFFSQAILISFVCSLIFLIGKKLFDKKTGFLGAIIACFYQPFITVTSNLNLENLIIFISVFYIYLLTKINKTSSNKKLFLLGIILGLAILIKAIFLTLLPIITIIWLIFFTKSGLKKIIVIVIGCVLSLMPWLIRNYYQFHSLIISTQSGPIFYVTTNPKYFNYTRLSGREAIWKHIQLSEIPRNNLLIKESINFFKENFRTYFQQFIRNFIGLFNIHSKFVISSLFLAILGALAAFFKRKKSLILIIFLLLFYSQYAVIFTFPRFRYPLDWILILFIAYIVILFVNKLGFKNKSIDSYLNIKNKISSEKLIKILEISFSFLGFIFIILVLKNYTKPLILPAYNKQTLSLKEIIKFQKDNNAFIFPYIGKTIAWKGIIKYINRNSYYPEGNAKDPKKNNDADYKNFMDIYIIPSTEFDSFDLLVNRNDYSRYYGDGIVTVNFKGHIGFSIKNNDEVEVHGKIIGQNFLGQIYIEGNKINKL